jgi:hypothetical protein
MYVGKQYAQHGSLFSCSLSFGQITGSCTTSACT